MPTTKQVCHVSVNPNKQSCNECLMSECNNCARNCLDVNECNQKFNVSINNLNHSPDMTQMVNVNTSNLGSQYPGNDFICNISPTGVGGDQYSINGEMYKSLDSLDNLNASVSHYNYEDPNGPVNVVLDSVQFIDNEPKVTVSVEDAMKFKKDFEIKTANESFVLIQDKYRDNFKKYKEFVDKHSELTPVDIDFYSLRNLDAESLARNLFLQVKNIYKLNNLDITTSSGDRALKQNELNQLKEEIDRNRVIIDDLKALNHTNKRRIEINVNRSRRMNDTNNVLSKVLIVVFIMLIFPILKKTGILKMSNAITGWCIVLLLVLAVMVYFLYYKNINRDALDYHRLNFVKPTDDEIAKSKALATISDKDKARCQAYAEMEQELEVPNINLDVSKYYSAEPTEDKCSKIE